MPCADAVVRCRAGFLPVPRPARFPARIRFAAVSVVVEPSGELRVRHRFGPVFAGSVPS
ncbi:hypothetical protein [Streptomyces sp. HNM0574]|uniref:hypothetical protein n=1 Tax=Streptomyces sp. HNM0574 TaxID=2714954 RepID=UPI00146B557C|nr:hypothetical protein [Streptomyces sp. HNM0574]NLU69734.1 hypothetical protein [Streptomyces sp. HNM0574]